LEDAGLTDRSGTKSRYGVAFASGLGINRLEDFQKWVAADKKFDVVKFGKEHSQVHRESIIRNNSNRTAALIASKFGFLGTNCTVTSGLWLRHPGSWDRYRTAAGGNDLMMVG
jgi:hypothetical protein